MKCLLLERVRFKLDGERLVWGIVLCQRQGLSLLYIPRPDPDRDNTLTVAVQTQENIFEAADTFSFPLEQGDLMEIGAKLQALGEDEFTLTRPRIIKREDLF
ncbi:MAG: hypothetical protein AB9869_33135 [Verrucomicrobiia bacterium]